MFFDFNCRHLIQIQLNSISVVGVEKALFLSEGNICAVHVCVCLCLCMCLYGCVCVPVYVCVCVCVLGNTRNPEWGANLAWICNTRFWEATVYDMILYRWYLFLYLCLQNIVCMQMIYYRLKRSLNKNHWGLFQGIFIANADQALLNSLIWNRKFNWVNVIVYLPTDAAGFQIGIVCWP